MSKTEIIAELPNLRADELAEVQAKLDELAGETWHDDVGLSDADKATLEASLKKHQQDPSAGSSWDEVRARLQATLRP